MSDYTSEVQKCILRSSRRWSDKRDIEMLPIRHVGIVLAICDHKTHSCLREDLGYDRYKSLDVRERFKDEKPYRICKRCLKIIHKRERW